MDKNIKIILGIFVSVILLSGAFAGGFIVGQVVPSNIQIPFNGDVATPFAPPTVTSEQQSSTPSELQTLFTPFWETWTLIHEQYVVQPVDDVQLLEGAINGMLQTLTSGRNYYLNPEALEQTNASLNGKEYEGIGAYVDVSGSYLTVISPIKGSPADQAGLRPRDQFIAIDGEDMTGISPETALQKVLGPEGTNVTLTILRAGTDEPFDVTITRAKIITPLVESEMLPDDIAYVRLNTFGDTADQELRKALEILLAKNPKGLVFDLRYNGGGYLYQGIAVASEFLPADQVVVYERLADGSLEENISTGNSITLDIPMVVLVNEGSASASEIVAGALQDYGRAKLVGVITYGKGSVQSMNPLSDGSVAAITSAHWLTPDKRLIQDIGLTPDIYVEYTPEDFEADRDPQLDAAIQTLLAILDNIAIPTSMPIPTSVNTPIP